ncbi:hypothetical protein BGZ65_010511, partial [Modicella reniformis]
MSYPSDFNDADFQPETVANLNVHSFFKSNPPSLWQPAIFALDPKVMSMTEFYLGLYRINKMDSSETACYAGR